MNLNPALNAHARNLIALSAVRPFTEAADTLEQRLREAGITAHSQTHRDDSGQYISLVSSIGDRQTILQWLDHYAVPKETVSFNEALGIYVYAVTVNGHTISLIVQQARISEPEKAAA